MKDLMEKKNHCEDCKDCACELKDELVNYTKRVDKKKVAVVSTVALALIGAATLAHKLLSDR